MPSCSPEQTKIAVTSEAKIKHYNANTRLKNLEKYKAPLASNERKLILFKYSDQLNRLFIIQLTRLKQVVYTYLINMNSKYHVP